MISSAFRMKSFQFFFEAFLLPQQVFIFSRFIINPMSNLRDSNFIYLNLYRMPRIDKLCADSLSITDTLIPVYAFFLANARSHPLLLR